ncbi:MAG: hypothetical protein GY757_01270, partial [bacterium]|nr:hypothetical protein [bacterium]
MGRETFSIYFLNETTGWIGVCSRELLLKTTDKGKNWVEQPVDGKIKVDTYGVYFLNNTIGWISGEKGVVMKTNDAGKTWKNQETGTDVRLFSI